MYSKQRKGYIFKIDKTNIEKKIMFFSAICAAC
jgi:hypothetical protein